MKQALQAQPPVSSDPAQDHQPQTTRIRRFFSVRTFGEGVRMAILLAFAFFFGVPLLWLLLAPSKNSNFALYTDPPISFGAFQNYVLAWQHLMVFNNSEILGWINNSILYSGAAVIISTLICLMAGYALGTSRFVGRRMILLITLIVMIIPGIAYVLPIFLEENAFHLIDTAAAVILPSSFYPFGTYLAFIYFATSIPKNLLDAGRMDGCNALQLFWHIGLPLSKPVIGLLAFFSFVGNWNNFFLPDLVLISDAKYNLPVGLTVLMQSAPGIHPKGGGNFLPIYGPEIAMAALIVVLPIVVIFIFSQRFVVQGTLVGAEKE